MEFPRTEVAGRTPTLLVVDDRSENLVAMEAILEDEPWRVLTAQSGSAAIDCLGREEVELVLLDVQMPGMDGFEVARRMREIERARHTPIIFISALAQSQEALVRGYDSGAIDFILKPLDSQVLLHKVRVLLALERQRRDLLDLSRQLNSALAFNASILDNAAEGILVLDVEGRVRYANPTMAAMLATTQAELDGRPLRHFLVSPALPESWQASELFHCWRRGETYRQHDAMLRSAIGTQLPVAVSLAPLGQDQAGSVLIALDMSVVNHLHAELEAQAQTDALTGLLNRRGFHHALEASLARSARNFTRLSVLYLDLDGFKRVNDSLGHAAGDAVLRHVSELLRASLRPYDVLARVGGDEFAALLENLNHPEDAARIAEKLVESLARRYRVQDVEVTLGMSIGIACYPECGRSVDNLLRAADMAMYEAKRAGRQQYRFFNQEMNGRARSRLMLEESLRQAVEQEQFLLHYQPQLSLRDNRLRGFEALLRWEHPGAGRIAPSVFIPLLEETRLINRLGGWILGKAVEQNLQLQQSLGQDLIISVNVSPLQFGMPQLMLHLQQVLEATGLAPAQLEVEVTESALMQDMDTTRAQLQQLRKLGVRVAIDDFGTGYSSLAYLRHFELDSLKIDRLFVASMLDSERDAAVVRSIIELSNNLGLEVIAEGVERVEQLDWLRQHGCHTVQGFLLAPGLSLVEAQDFRANEVMAGWGGPGVGPAAEG